MIAGVVRCAAALRCLREAHRGSTATWPVRRPQPGDREEGNRSTPEGWGPWPYRSEVFHGDDPTDFCLREFERTIEQIGAHHIAAMIGEPIMGVAGMIVPPDDYWPRVRELLSNHGILLVLDEVVTAYGRTGNWFAAQHFGVEPDIIVTAKGITSGYMPLGAVLISGPIAEVLGQGHGFPMG